MADDAVLEVSELRAGYGAGDILQEVSLRVAEGEIVAVVGRNGVGKTTLMRSIVGLLRTRAGAVRFRGQDLTRRRPRERALAGIGYVPQGREIFPELTVEENLRMGDAIGAAGNGRKRTRYELVYDYFPILHERRRQLGATFSGGQQQMLAIGRALVGNPKLLLLDEPSVGIQPSIIQEIAASLARLNAEEGLTMVLVEQNLGMIRQLGQRGYAIDKGRVTATLDRDELRDRDLLAGHLAI